MPEFTTWTAAPARGRHRAARPAVAVAGAATLAAGLLAAPTAAFAEEAELTVGASAWYHAPTAGTPLPAPGQPPEQLANPTDGLPVGMQNAQHEFRSAVKFALPAVPEGALVTRFEVTFTETAEEGTVPGVEACAFTEAFQPEPNQPMDAVPAFDCSFSGSLTPGEEDDPNTEQDESATWTVDLADTAGAWVAGDLADHGFVIQVINPDNLPVGQPNPAQSNGKITFAGPESETPPTAVIEYTLPVTTEVDDVEFAPPPPPANSGGGTSSSGSADFQFSSPQFDQEPAPTFEEAPAPEVAEPVPAQAAPPEVAAPPPAETAPAAVAGATTPQTPGYVWLLAPVGLGGLYVLARSLTAEPALAVEREGAVTRLLRQRRGAAGADEGAATSSPLLQP